MKKNCKTHYKLFVKNNDILYYDRCDVKELLKVNPKLIIANNKNIIYELDNIQSLYLFPLTVIVSVFTLYTALSITAADTVAVNIIATIVNKAITFKNLKFLIFHIRTIVRIPPL